MFFDFTNASITFQNIINDILRFFLNKFVIVYLNDILIYFQNDEKHLEYIKLVIETFHKNNYYAKSSKCFFFQKHVEFCEHVIENDKIQMNEKKLKTIRDWSSLQTIHDVRFFLKLCVYYCKFIKDFVSITKSLYELIKNVEKKNSNRL